MAKHIKDFYIDQETCMRCSCCKFTDPYAPTRSETLYSCPSIHKYNFHAFSGGGKYSVAFSINEGHTDINETTADIAYKCTLCGACDTICKSNFKYMDPMDNILALRMDCVEAGQTLKPHEEMIASLKENGNMLCADRAGRIAWEDKTPVKQLVKKETGKYFFHAGCLYGYDESLQERLVGMVNLLCEAGVDLITAGVSETCCGSKALQLGFIEEGKAAARALKTKLEKAEAKVLVTPCAHCYSAFKYYYPKFGIDLGVEIMHVTEVFDSLIADGAIKPGATEVGTVTYHDPCNLGRKSEPPKPDFDGDKRERPMALTRTGELGIFDEPRNVITAIPGVELVEMERKRQYSYCCGNGAGVAEANPDLVEFAGKQRIQEAGFTGADTLVTACPWCERSLRDAAEKEGMDLQVMDVADLVIKSVKEV